MFRKFLLIILSILYSGLLFSQNSYKLGYIDSDKLIQAMPEYDSARNKFEKIIRDYEKELEIMKIEFNSKYQDYINKKDGYPELIRKMKETELQDLDNRMRQFQLTFQENIEMIREEIFTPVIEKAKSTVSIVAKENNFSYIFDLSAGFVVYSDENAINILPLVKQKLGIK